MLPQFPLTEQQEPKVLPVQVAPVVDAAPHLPSRLIGVVVGTADEDFVLLDDVVDVGLLVVDDEVMELHCPHLVWLSSSQSWPYIISAW